MSKEVKINWRDKNQELEKDILDLIKKHKVFYSKGIIKDRFLTIIHANNNIILKDLIGR